MAEENRQAEEILESVGAVRALDTVHTRIGGYFHRREMRERVRRYLVGRLGHVERKNSWQLAEAFGEAGFPRKERPVPAADWGAEAALPLVAGPRVSPPVGLTLRGGVVCGEGASAGRAA